MHLKKKKMKNTSKTHSNTTNDTYKAEAVVRRCSSL